MREFLKVAGKPDMISFAGGLPDSTLLPTEHVQSACERALRDFGAATLQYGTSEGVNELRDYVASRFPNLAITGENVLITSGSQQALDIVGRVFLEKDRTVRVQNPTYLAALSAWAPLGVRYADIAQWMVGEGGADLVYSIPNFRNPSGETVTAEDRYQLVENASRSPVPVIEDDAYGDLRYEGETLPSILETSGSVKGPVVHIGTLSKILAPGLRVGWIVADKALIHTFTRARQAMDLHTSTLSQFIALQMIKDGVLERLLPKARETYRRKRDLMLRCFQNTMPSGFRWTRPEGGLFILLKLPEGMSGRDFAEKALLAGVAVVPGEEFHVSGGEATVRLNFSFPRPEQIEKGILKLAEIAKTSIGELYLKDTSTSTDRMESTCRASKEFAFEDTAKRRK